jgi:hypothetical protein
MDIDRPKGQIYSGVCCWSIRGGRLVAVLVSLAEFADTGRMRQEAEQFSDGKQTIRSYDAEGRLCCIETVAPSGELQAAIDYLYDAAGNNVERIVRDGVGMVLRRIFFDTEGKELNADAAGPVRWASMDGADDGLDPKGKERINEEKINEEQVGEEKINEEKINEEQVGEENIDKEKINKEKIDDKDQD